MKYSHSQNRIIELMSRFVSQIKGSTAMGKTDLNLAAENILLPIFSLVFDCPSLKNLNSEESANYPGIDLGDESSKFAFQITSSATTEKIKHTLEQFVKHKLYKRFNRLIIYILTEKQKTYSGRTYADITQGRVEFDKDKDILDYRDLLSIIASLPLGSIQRVESILEEHFGDGPAPASSVWSPHVSEEEVYVNLVELHLPDTLHVADIAIDRDEAIAGSRGRNKIRLRKGSSTRDVIRSALEQRNLGFGTDWICHENKIVTFHNLGDSAIPLSILIDAGTLTPLSPSEFYSANEDYERVFKSLLWRTLQQQFFHRGLQWQNEERVFIFKADNDKDKVKEFWEGKNTPGRTVFERTRKSTNSDETLYCKHLAFKVIFKRYASKWFTLFRPTWFFSSDGYRKSYYHGEKVSWLRRRENNAQVMNLLGFILNYIDRERPMLFDSSVSPEFLTFGKLQRFTTSPAIDDDAWNKKSGREDPAQEELFRE